MKMRAIIYVLVAIFGTFYLANCSDDSDSRSAGSDSDGDSDSDSDTGPGYFGDLAGTVVSATGFPISGALVYMTNGDGADIPDEVYCYTCDNMTDQKWTLTNADGTWFIGQVPAGERNLVTRKGFFQRQRSITVIQDVVNDIPIEKTTLPGVGTDDGLDQIPNYAVLLNWYDRPEDMLAKMGMAQLDATGHVESGTENFDMYNDSETYPSAVGESSSMFSQGQGWINQYHMVFFPCICGMNTAADHIPMLKSYVEAGGKIYGSCYAGQWPEQPFPDIIDFRGDDTGTSPGSGSQYSTTGKIEDQEMREWLAVVAPTENVDSFPFHGAWVVMDSVSSGYDGHGVLDNGSIGGMVEPTVWVTDLQESPGSPLTVTFPYDCGKVFFSSYQVVESEPSPAVRAQEWVLIYLFYDIGVCEGDYEPPE